MALAILSNGSNCHVNSFLQADMVEGIFAGESIPYILEETPDITLT